MSSRPNEKRRRQWLWLVATAIVLALIIYNLGRSPEWRRFHWGELWTILLSARQEFLLVAVGATLFTYLIRAYRWKYFLHPIKDASLKVVFIGQVLGFSSIYLVGRAGELVRPAYIAKKEGVSFTSQLAILLLERIYDSVSIVLLLAVSLYVVPVDIPTAGKARVLEWARWGGIVMFVGTAMVIAALVLFRHYTKPLMTAVMKVASFLPEKVRHHLEHFMTCFADGLEIIGAWKDFLASVAATVLLWFLNASIFWLVFQSLGGKVAMLPWLAAGTVLFCAALGLVLQFPGIGGGYQVGIMLALTGFFGIQAVPATGAALLIWILIAFPCLLLGAGLLVYEGLTFKKLEAIVEEEEKSAATMENA